MDKYEYQVCADQIKNFIAEKKYAEAMEIADKIDWRRVKSVSMLCTVSEIYKVNKRYEESRDILLLAYDRYPKGRMIVYALCELALKMNDIVQAVEYYKEFVRLAPGDTGSYILLYKIYEAQDVAVDERIKVLEEFKKRDYRERWAYELALLYHRTGQETRCVDECDELILWFGEGKYVKKAMELKQQHAHLSRDQQQKYDAAGKASAGYQNSYYQPQATGPVDTAGQPGAANAPYSIGQQAGTSGIQGGTQGPDPEQAQGAYSTGQNMYGGYAQGGYAPAQSGIESTPLVPDSSDRFSTQNLQAELQQSMEAYLNASGADDTPMGLGTGELNVIDTGRINTGSLRTGELDVIDTGQINTGALRTGELDVINTGQINTGALRTGELDVINTGQINAGALQTGELDVINTGQIQTGELLGEEAAYGMPGMTATQVESGVPEKTQEFVFDANANYMQQFMQTYIAPQAPQYDQSQEPESQASQYDQGQGFESQAPQYDQGQEPELQAPQYEAPSDGGEPVMGFKALAGVVTEEVGNALGMEDSGADIEAEAVEIETEEAVDEEQGAEADGEAEAEALETEAIEAETGADEAAESEETGAEEDNIEGTEEATGTEAETDTEPADEETEPEETEADEAAESEETGAEEDNIEGAEEAAGTETETDTEPAEEAAEPEETESDGAGESEGTEAEEDNIEGTEEATGTEKEADTEPADKATEPEESQEKPVYDPEEEIRRRINDIQKKYDSMLGQEYNGQLRISIPDVDMVEKQITGQIDIEEILRNRKNRFENTEDMESQLSGVIADWSATGTASEETNVSVSVLEESPGIDLSAVAEIMAENQAGETPEAIEEGTNATGEEAETEADPEITTGAETEETETEVPEEDQPSFSYELEDYGEVEEIEDIEQPDEVDDIIKTSNLPIEEIAEYNALAEQALNAEKAEQLPSNYDENGRMKHPSYMVLEEARKSRRDFDEYEYKLFGRYDGIENVKAQLVDVIDSMSMQADIGNIVVVGDEVTCRKAMSIDLVKAMQARDSSFMGKVAKISGEALNKKNIPSTLRKLNNGALIVENAGGLSAAALTIITQSLAKEVGSVLIILEGDAEPIERLLETNPTMFDPAFNARINIEEFTNDDLVAYARGYAREREHSIDEMGILALYTRIGELQTLDHRVTVEDIKELIDLAIIHVDKMSIGHLMDVLVSKRYDDDDNIIIREKDFLLDEKKQEKLQKRQKKQKSKKGKAES
ncbi:MAG: hypothetical protein IJT16_13280 [Lachnospiraceae bacterium]|nr:hypothetical protein [Lachnospiraceae bacterium]